MPRSDRSVREQNRCDDCLLRLAPDAWAPAAKRAAKLGELYSSMRQLLQGHEKR